MTYSKHLELDPLAIGLLDNKLVLLTRQLILVEHPMKNLSENFRHLYQNQSGIPLTTKWPWVDDRRLFRIIKDKFLSGFFFNNSTDAFMFLVFESRDNYNAICIDVKAKKTFLGKFLDEPTYRLISNTGLLTFYMFRLLNNQLQMNYFDVTFKADKDGWFTTFEIKVKGQWRFLCQQNMKPYYIYLNSKECLKQPDLNLLTGSTFHNQIYLIDVDKVYNISTEIFYSGSMVPFEQNIFYSGGLFSCNIDFSGYYNGKPKPKNLKPKPKNLNL